jgi:hypothetical protein
MKYLAFGLIAAATLCTACFAAEDVVRIDTAVAVHDVPRFGVNLGFRTSWGAEQLMANVVMNPGFEGIVDRCLVTAMGWSDLRGSHRQRRGIYGPNRRIPKEWSE